MLKTGDFVFDKAAGASVQVLDRIEAWGYISYRVFNSATGKVYKATEDQLNTDSGTNTYDENYLRYVTLLCKIKNETADDIRELALSLIRAYPDYALPIHWCMMLITYPVFSDVCKLIGRISDFQDEITLAQLKQKLFDEWGERTTLFHSTDKIITTMKEMGALSCEKPGKYHIQKYPISNEQIVNFMLLVAIKVGGNSYYTRPDLTNIGVLFPFEYRVNKEQLITDDHFVINNFGGEITVALK